MSAVYPSFKGRLIQLLVGEGMAGGATLYVVGVDESYVYDPAHTTFEDVPVESLVFPPTELTGSTLGGTTLAADDIELGGALIGTTCHGIIVLFAWADEVETALVCFIDETTDTSLPQDIITGSLEIRWAESGICRI